MSHANSAEKVALRPGEPERRSEVTPPGDKEEQRETARNGKIYVSGSGNNAFRITAGDLGTPCLCGSDCSSGLCNGVCVTSICGDGVVEPGEQCDDGNTQDGDCCSSTCQFEDLGVTDCGTGACYRVEPNCINGVWRDCTPGTPSPEVCDGIDNDCNGLVDDGLGTTTCGVGTCARTVENCVGGAPQTCTPQPDGSACDDGNACTQTDTCQSGTCVGTSPVQCTAQDQCHDAGTCSPSTGVCSNPSKADGSPCNDGDGCPADTCRAGVCQPVSCPNVDAVALPAKPLSVTIPSGKMSVSKTLSVSVRNADTVDRTISLAVDGSGCPTGVAGLPDGHQSSAWRLSSRGRHARGKCPAYEADLSRPCGRTFGTIHSRACGERRRSRSACRPISCEKSTVSRAR